VVVIKSNSPRFAHYIGHWHLVSGRRTPPPPLVYITGSCKYKLDSYGYNLISWLS